MTLRLTFWFDANIKLQHPTVLDTESSYKNCAQYDWIKHFTEPQSDKRHSAIFDNLPYPFLPPLPPPPPPPPIPYSEHNHDFYCVPRPWCWLWFNCHLMWTLNSSIQLFFTPDCSCLLSVMEVHVLVTFLFYRQWKRCIYLIDRVSSGRTGRISARGLGSTDQAASARSVQERPRADIFSVRPEQTRSIRDLLHDF